MATKHVPKGSLFISNKNESVRMFRSDFLESFSHVHPVTPLVIYLPVIAYLLYTTLGELGGSAFTVAGLVVGGLGIWTLIEYGLHRFVFHYEPDTPWGKRLHFTMHGVHHDYPNDSTRLVMPPSLSIPLGLGFYLLYSRLFGPYANALFAGTVAGYLAYDMLHYATHHFAMRGPILSWLKKNHLRHHYRDKATRFGVTSPIWDYVFRTR
jgi:4-hydroxysphinganine ceramide fatty acyl 2-hydroxylase